MTNKSVSPQQEHFLIVEDDKGRKQVPLTEKTYSLGRSTDCDICLNSQFVSRHHATLMRIVKENGETSYHIRDGDSQGKASVNGLLINGNKSTESELKHGDTVVFGPQVFAVYHNLRRDKFPTLPGNDPFDITLIDPSMMMEDNEIRREP